jgi:serine/threonine protein kinase
MKVWQKKITDVPQRRIPHLLFIAGTKFSFEAGINLYIVTDYLPGGELFCHFEKEGRWFSEERVRFYVAEIVLALEELHNHNIIYRDLKPENILLDATGHIGLCGFGLSRTSKVLRTNTFCGTTEYLAPEVLLDENGFTNMVDFWSLGVLFFHMSFGWSPFYAKDTQQMYKNICFGKARFPRNVLSTEGVNLVKGLLNRNPKHRLGVSGGAEELKRHPFFASIEWDALAKKLVTPPLTPPLESQAGPLVSVLSNSLDNRIATLAANMRSTPFTLGMQANFKGFTFVDERSLDGHVQRLGVPDEEEEQGNDLEDLAIKIHRR